MRSLPTGLYSDGWQPYIAAVGDSFALAVDHVQVVKNYSRKARRDDLGEKCEAAPRDRGDSHYQSGIEIGANSTSGRAR